MYPTACQTTAQEDMTDLLEHYPELLKTLRKLNQARQARCACSACPCLAAATCMLPVCTALHAGCRNQTFRPSPMQVPDAEEYHQGSAWWRRARNRSWRSSRLRELSARTWSGFKRTAVWVPEPCRRDKGACVNGQALKIILSFSALRFSVKPRSTTPLHPAGGGANAARRGRLLDSTCRHWPAARSSLFSAA